MSKDDFQIIFDCAYNRLARSSTKSILINNTGYIYGLVDLARWSNIIESSEATTLECQIKDCFELKNFEL